MSFEDLAKALVGAIVIGVALAIFGYWPATVSGWAALAFWMLLLLLTWMMQLLAEIKQTLAVIAIAVSATDERVAEANRRLMDIEHLLDMRLEKSDFE